MKTTRSFKRSVICSLIVISTLLSGCKDIQILQVAPPTEAQYESSKDMMLNTYYVKNSTRFAQVYYPEGNASGIAKSVKGSRVLYFNGDQAMVPTHYKGEIVAYASKSASLENVTLERFMDMGYSIGVYGGDYEDDGYYHISVKKNVCLFSQAEELFKQVISDEIRIIAINGEPIGNILDKESGIITGLEEGETCIIEFYSGTYYYRQKTTADIQFLKAYEVSNYDSKYISDTRNGYMCFETPQNLRSGYYLINGSGMFLYHDYTRSEVRDYENYNESSYMTAEEAIAAYSREYAVSIAKNTKNVVMNVNCLTELDEDATGKVIAPDGTIYDMDANLDTNVLSLTLSLAQAGEWKVYIPQYIAVKEVFADSKYLYEDTVCYEDVYTFDEDITFQRFQILVYGDGEVYGTLMCDSDTRTYTFKEDKYRLDNGKEQRYLHIEMPYLKADTYTIKIYYYQSSTELGELEITTYEDVDSDIFILE